TMSKRDWSSDVCSSDLKTNKLTLISSNKYKNIPSRSLATKGSSRKGAQGPLTLYGENSVQQPDQSSSVLLSGCRALLSPSPLTRSEERRVANENGSPRR